MVGVAFGSNLVRQAAGTKPGNRQPGGGCLVFAGVDGGVLSGLGGSVVTGSSIVGLGGSFVKGSFARILVVAVEVGVTLRRNPSAPRVNSTVSETR
jgi:hypothetical protein